MLLRAQSRATFSFIIQEQARGRGRGRERGMVLWSSSTSWLAGLVYKLKLLERESCKSLIETFFKTACFLLQHILGYYRPGSTGWRQTPATVNARTQARDAAAIFGGRRKRRDKFHSIHFPI